MVQEDSRMLNHWPNRLVALVFAALSSAVAHATLPSCYGIEPRENVFEGGAGVTCHYLCTTWHACNGERVYRGSGQTRWATTVCDRIAIATFDNSTPPQLVCIGGVPGFHSVTVEGCEPNSTPCNRPGEEGDICPQC